VTRWRETLSRIVAPPTWPESVEREARPRNIGLEYATEWTRTPVSRVVRAVVLDGIAAPLNRLIASPTVLGADIVERIDGPVIFAANHTSHLDTTLILGALPMSVRHKTVVAAASDYFFDRPWKAAASSLLLGAIPVDRCAHRRRMAPRDLSRRGKKSRRLGAGVPWRRRLPRETVQRPGHPGPPRRCPCDLPEGIDVDHSG
jgi:hypothetical protein